MNRTEMILTLIDRLGVVSVRQLHCIMKMGSYRNTCRIISNLSSYLHEVRGREKVVYLNKDGRDLIASDNEVKKSILFDHMLLANEAYIYFNCPQTWQREYTIESVADDDYGFSIQIGSTAVKAKKKLISDAVYTRNGYVHLVEIDNTRHMQDNIKKINSYKEMWPNIKSKFNMQSVLYFFTTTETRKRKLITVAKGLNMEVYTFDDIK